MWTDWLIWTYQPDYRFPSDLGNILSENSVKWVAISNFDTQARISAKCFGRIRSTLYLASTAFHQDCSISRLTHRRLFSTSRRITQVGRNLVSFSSLNSFSLGMKLSNCHSNSINILFFIRTYNPIKFRIVMLIALSADVL